MCQSSEEQQFRIFALGLDAYLYIAKFLFPQQIYCINLKGTVSASSLFSSRQLATCSSRPPRRGGGVRSRASSTPNCILEWKIRPRTLLLLAKLNCKQKDKEPLVLCLVSIAATYRQIGSIIKRTTSAHISGPGSPLRRRGSSLPL